MYNISMKICSKCKREYADSVLFCGQCGVKLMDLAAFRRQQQAEQDRLNLEKRIMAQVDSCYAAIEKLKPHIDKFKYYPPNISYFKEKAFWFKNPAYDQINESSIAKLKELEATILDRYDLYVAHVVHTPRKMYDELYAKYIAVKKKYEQLLPIYEAAKATPSRGYNVDKPETYLNITREIKAFLDGGEFNVCDKMESVWIEQEGKPWETTIYHHYVYTKGIAERLKDDVLSGAFLCGETYLCIEAALKLLEYVLDENLRTMSATLKGRYSGPAYTIDLHACRDLGVLAQGYLQYKGRRYMYMGRYYPR